MAWAKKRKEPGDGKAPVESAVLERALRLLNVRGRSVGELRRRLMERGDVSEEMAERVLAKLTDWGFLDDGRFAEQFGESHALYRKQGRARIERDLRNLSVPEAVIQEALDSVYERVDEGELIDELVEKHVRLKGAPSHQAEVKKLSEQLQRKGFGWDQVAPKLKTLSDDAKRQESAERAAQAEQRRQDKKTGGGGGEPPPEDPTQEDPNTREQELIDWVAKLVRTLGHPKTQQEFKRFSDRLARRGFSWGQIRPHLDALKGGG